MGHLRHILSPAVLINCAVTNSLHTCGNFTFRVVWTDKNILLGGIAEKILPVVTHVTVTWSVRLYVCMSSVTLVNPAKAVGRNEMLFGRDTCVVPSKTLLDRGPGPQGEGEILGVGTPGWHRRCQFTLVRSQLSYPIKSNQVAEIDDFHRQHL